MFLYIQTLGRQNLKLAQVRYCSGLAVLVDGATNQFTNNRRAKRALSGFCFVISFEAGSVGCKILRGSLSGPSAVQPQPRGTSRLHRGRTRHRRLRAPLPHVKTVVQALSQVRRRLTTLSRRRSSSPSTPRLSRSRHRTRPRRRTLSHRLSRRNHWLLRPHVSAHRQIVSLVFCGGGGFRY